MTRTMKGLTYDGPGRLTPGEVPIPEVVARDDVLVRPNYAGICFTEKHVYDGLFPTSPRQTTYATGQVWGHEFGGVVTDLGSEVADLKIGDRVAINPFMRCHACLMCQAGLYSKCEKVSCVGMSLTGGASPSTASSPATSAIRFLRASRSLPVASSSPWRRRRGWPGEGS